MTHLPEEIYKKHKADVDASYDEVSAGKKTWKVHEELLMRIKGEEEPFDEERQAEASL